MPKAKGKVEFRYFLDPGLKAAAMRKCEEQGTNLTFILTRFLKQWTADAPPSPMMPKPPTGRRVHM